MQKIGAHVSAAKGVSNAPLNAHLEKCEVFQFFVSSPQSYKMNDISDEETQKFKDRCKEFGFTETYVHASYLINLASPNSRVRYGSITLLRKGLETCSRLGVKGMMFHTGSATGHPTKEAAIEKAIQSLNKVLDGYTGSTKLLIENAAGAGGTLGVTFKEVGQLLKGITQQSKAGVCLDTQHAFASGYDWRTTAGATAVMKEFSTEIGIRHLAVVQYNDSKSDCGSNKDRHEHIALGKMGVPAAKNILNLPQLKKMSFIFETEPEGRAQDIDTLKEIRKNIS